jgi:rhodanese-related sulfurtransferase
MTDAIRRVSAASLKAALHDGGEIAVLDAREEVAFGKRHLLLASCVPLSQLELRLDDLVPRRDARVVWCDGGERLAEEAARRMAGFGWRDVAVLDGGIEAWAAAGYRLYSGVHVPSKAFAEVVEHEAGTPWITAEQLNGMIESGADIAIFDSRSYPEYHGNSIPTAVSVPGAELVYRFKDLASSPETTVIVNCGGRTRSIIGAQSLINAGVPNKVVSLKDGTMAWHLAGFEVVKGAARRPPEVSAAGLAAAREAATGVAARLGIPRIERGQLEAWRADAARTLYVFDVRTPEEYEAGHLPGARSAPGGQLVQETDSHAATWGARIVLADDTGVRANMTASWLKQMGWDEVAVLSFDPSAADLVKGPHRPKVLGLEAADPPSISVATLQAKLGDDNVSVVDLASSRRYRQGHIPGAWFAVRARLDRVLARLQAVETVVLTSPDGVLARLAAAEQPAPTLVLEGGTAAWAAAGQPLETGPTHMADEADDVWLSARDRDSDREAHMREYLAWEIDLVNQMAADDDQRFRVFAG